MPSLSDVKDASIPFGVYDLFGYLMPGLFLIILYIVDHDAGSAFYYYHDKDGLAISGFNLSNSSFKISYLMKFLTWGDDSSEFKIVPFVMIIIVAYLIGHLIAAISSVVIEKYILIKTISYPSNNLFKINTRHNWMFKLLASRYCSPFDDNFIKKFSEVINVRFGYEVNPHDYYWMSYSDVIKYMSGSYLRIQHFVSLYGFARNMCATFAVYTLLRIFLVIFYILFSVDYSFNVFNIFIILSYVGITFILFFSYIKLFKRQTIELFFTFYALHTDKLKASEATK